MSVHTGAETIQGRKLFKGGNYSRKYGIFSLLSVLDLIFSQVKLSDSLSFAIDKELPLSQNEKTLYRSIDYYTNLSNQKFLS